MQQHRATKKHRLTQPIERARKKPNLGRSNSTDKVHIPAKVVPKIVFKPCSKPSIPELRDSAATCLVLEWSPGAVDVGWIVMGYRVAMHEVTTDGTAPKWRTKVADTGTVEPTAVIEQLIPGSKYCFKVSTRLCLYNTILTEDSCILTYITLC